MEIDIQTWPRTQLAFGFVEAVGRKLAVEGKGEMLIESWVVLKKTGRSFHIF